jgi:hypothetical protein
MRPPPAPATLRMLLAILVGVTACHDNGEDRSFAIVVTDSAGQIHVSLGELDRITAPRLDVEPLYSTHEDTALALHWVTAARFLGDGTLAVADNGDQAILLLDSDGRLARRVGRAGEGPGEFRFISELHVDGHGNLVVHDERLGRLTTLDRDGHAVAVGRLASSTRLRDLRVVGILEDDRVLAINWSTRDFTVLGERRDTTPLFLLDPARGTVDTVGIWLSQEWHFLPIPAGGVLLNDVGLGRTLAHAGRSGLAALGSTDSLDVTVLGGDGRVVMRVRGAGAGPRATPAELERWRADLHRRAARARQELQPAILETPHRETYPAFASLLVDDARRLWIGAYPRPGQAEQRFVLIGADGTLQGVLDLPAGATVLDAAGDRIALLRRTDLDEEYVQVLRIAGLA